MYPVKSVRRRKALWLAASAAAIACHCLPVPVARGATVDTYTGGTAGNWNGSNTTIWSAGVPAAGYAVNMFKLGNVTYTATSAVDLQSLQIAGSSNTSLMELTISSSSANLESMGLYLGPGATNNSTGGYGEVIQSNGIVTLDPGSLLSIDSISTYSLSGSGYLNGYNESNAGTFTQNGGQNLLDAGGTFNNSGTYTAENGGSFTADYIINSGFFNQSYGATVKATSSLNTSLNVITNSGIYQLAGTSATYPSTVLSTALINNSGTFNQATGATLNGSNGGNVVFNNSNTYLFAGGTFTGRMNNNAGALVSITGASIPFSQGILENGEMIVSNGSGSYLQPITGSGYMIFSGASNNITLAGTNAYTGSTSVTGGTLTLAGPVGTSANSYGGSLQGNLSIGTGATVQTNADCQIANTAVLTINGGTFNLNSYTESVGSLTMYAGQINQSGGLPLGIISGNITIGKTGAVITGGLRSSSNFNVSIPANMTLTVNGVMSNYAVNGSTGLTLTGTGGTLGISANSMLSTININSGMLEIIEGGMFDGLNSSITVGANGSLNLNNQTILTGDLIGSGAVAIGSGALTVVSTGSTFSGLITGSGTLTKEGAGTLTLSGSDSASGTTDIYAGTFTLAYSGSFAGNVLSAATGTVTNINGTLTNTPLITADGTLNFGANNTSGFLLRTLGGLIIGPSSNVANGVVNVAFASPHSARTLIMTSSLSFSGTTNAWSGKLDLSNNDMIVHYGSLSTITNQVESGYNNGNWNGSGITSSAAAADSTHLTALGVILNANDSNVPLYASGSPLGSFDGYNPAATDVLVKYTYYGDANLNGDVDGTDYALIDNGYMNQLTGWYNGDFNYDGAVNGSDYTLMDNAFNNQGSSLASIIASPDAVTTSQIAGAQPAAAASVPEPASGGLLGILSLSLLRHRAQRRRQSL
jgi:autotransporter-associated beta strand protein